MRRETGASRVLQAGKDSQGEMDLVGLQGPLETLVHRGKVHQALLETEAPPGSQDKRDYWDLWVLRDKVWLEPWDCVGSLGIQEFQDFLVFEGKGDLKVTLFHVFLKIPVLPGRRETLGVQVLQAPQVLQVTKVRRG